MSKRAEAAALEAYPKEIRDKTGFVIDIGHPQWIRDYYIQGYEQAEKDTIERACDMLMNYVFEEVTPEMRDHFRKRLEEE